MESQCYSTYKADDTSKGSPRTMFIIFLVIIILFCVLLQVKGSLEASVLCLTTIGIVKLSLRQMDDVKVCTCIRMYMYTYIVCA